MKKGQIAEGNVTTVEFPNKGIVMTDEGERVIVKNTIPGQRVSFAVNKVRKGKAEGRLLETVKKSPRETADTCRHFGQCGGCTYQSLPYEEQLKIKETQVRGMIEQAIGDACAYEFFQSDTVRVCLLTVTKWNFHLEMNTRTDRWHLECTSAAVFTTL